MRPLLHGFGKYLNMFLITEDQIAVHTAEEPNAGQWMTVRYNAAQQKPELGKEFRLADCAGY